MKNLDKFKLLVVDRNNDRLNMGGGYLLCYVVQTTEDRITVATGDDASLQTYKSCYLVNATSEQVEAMLPKCRNDFKAIVESDNDSDPLYSNKSELLTCEDCGCTDTTVKEGTCPHERDLNAKEVPVKLCPTCHEQRSHHL